VETYYRRSEQRTARLRLGDLRGPDPAAEARDRDGEQKFYAQDFYEVADG